jgi:hypothetical protein
MIDSFWGQRPFVPLLLLGPPFFPIILFGYTTLLAGMTGISLHIQWPLTSQLRGSVSKKTIVFLLWIKLHAMIDSSSRFSPFFGEKMAFILKKTRL